MPITTLFSVTVFVMGFVLGAILVALWMRGRVVELDAARRLAEVNLSSAQNNSGKLERRFKPWPTRPCEPPNRRFWTRRAPRLKPCVSR